MLTDLRIGFRNLLKSPGFALVAIIALALGVGANTAIFSLLNSLLFNPPEIRDASRVVNLRTTYAKMDGLKDISLSSPSFKDIEALTDVFSSVTIANTMDFNYTNQDTPERLRGAVVTPGWFAVTGFQPAMGRPFGPDEDQPGRNRVVVLAHSTWVRLFGADPNIAGRKIQLNEEAHEIIGVMPEGFRLPMQADLWAPLGLPAENYTARFRRNESYAGLGRLKDGVSIEQANAKVRALGEQIVQRENRGRNAPGWGLFVKPFNELLGAQAKLGLSTLMAAVVFVFLIACANVAGMQLARASSRSREMAIRAALGGTRLKMVQQLLAEGVLIAVPAAVLGVAIGWISARLLIAALPPLPITIAPQVDWQLLSFTAALACAGALIFALLPAWQGTRVNQADALREGGRSGTAGTARQRLRSALVIAEMAMALVMVAATGLLLRSLAEVQKVDPGFRPDGIQSGMVSLPRTRYPERAQRAQFYDQAVTRLRALPGVSGAAAAAPLPFSGNNWSGSFEIEGFTVPAGEPGPHGEQRYVSDGYFELMGVRLLKGRLFTEQDREGSAPVTILDEKMAKRYFPNGDAVGRKMRRGGPTVPWSTIVGVVAYFHHSELETQTKGAYFYPMAQSPTPSAALLVRTSGDPAAMSNGMRQAVRDVDANQPVFDLQSMRLRVDQSLSSRKMIIVLLSVFAGLALLLAALGLYGVIAYSVSQRTQEIGVRLALGAQRGQVLRMILEHGGRLALIAVVIGLAAALAVTRLLGTQLYQVGSFDPLTFGVTAAVLALVALAACFVPAWRATKVDPMVALRYE